jgi:EmrB/QacA subfamily drug resistance transporter
VQGVGAALMMPATLSIVTHAFPPNERGKAMGTWAGVSGLALAVGPVVGGLLTEHVSWRAIFYLNIPVAIGAVLASLFAVRESRDTTVGREVDFAGVAALTGGLTALVLALIEGNSWGWGSPEIVALLVGAVLGLVAFVAIELRVRVPMVEFHLFSDRNFVGAVVVAMIVSFSMLGVFFFLALYMQDVLRYSPLEAGIRFLPSTLMIVGLAPIAGRLADRFGPRWLIVAGLAVVAASLYSFSGIAVDSSYPELLPGFMLLGIGIALTMSPMTSAAMNAVPVEKAGIASGVLSMFRMVGGSLGVAVTGAIFQGSVGASFTEASPQQFVDALGHAMSVCAVVAVIGAAIGAAAIRGRPGSAPAAVAEAAVSPGGEELAGAARTADRRDPAVATSRP